LTVIGFLKDVIDEFILNELKTLSEILDDLIIVFFEVLILWSVLWHLVG